VRDFRFGKRDLLSGWGLSLEKKAKGDVRDCQDFSISLISKA
jgi:hypothetical protein